MATIRKRESKSGITWQAIIRKKGQKQVARTFDYKEDAEKWARSVEREMDTNAYIPSDTAQRSTLAEVLKRYSDEVLPRLSKGAKPDQSRILRLIEALGSLNLAALEASHVSQYRDNRLLTDLASPQTVKHELGLLNRVLKHCVVDWGIHLPRGIVTAQVRKPAPSSGRDRRLCFDEEKRLLGAARASKGKEIELIIVIAIETAARRGEIHAMKWQHIDFQKRTWKIPETKTGIPRNVPLSLRAVGVLQSLPRHLNGKVWQIGREDGITQAFRRVCGNCFPDLNFHDLRHEATSRLFEKGFNVMEVSSITGHKDLRMLRRYTHLRAEDLVERLG